MQVNKTSKNKRKKLIYLILLVLLCIGTIGGTVWYYYMNTTSNKPSVITGDFLPAGKDAQKLSDQQLASYGQNAVNKSRFQMVINPDIIVKESTNASNIYIENPKTNAYPIAVTIKLKDGESIYSSGAIKTGYFVKDAMFDKKLKQGNYSGTATFKIYDNKTSKLKGKVSTAVHINVNK